MLTSGFVERILVCRKVCITSQGLPGREAGSWMMGQESGVSGWEAEFLLVDFGPVDQKNQSMPVTITRGHQYPGPCGMPLVCVKLLNLSI